MSDAPAKSPEYRVEVRFGKQYYCRLVYRKNGKIIMTTETYATKWGARRAGKRLAAVNSFEYKECL